MSGFRATVHEGPLVVSKRTAAPCGGDGPGGGGGGGGRGGSGGRGGGGYRDKTPGRIAEEILKETPELRRMREKFGKKGFKGGLG